MEEQLTPAQPAPSPTPSAAPASAVMGRHTHAGTWLLGILFVMTLLTLVAAAVYGIQTQGKLLRETEQERQEKEEALAMLEQKETEAMKLAAELEASAVPEDAMIAYGGLLSPHERETGTDSSLFQSTSATYIGTQVESWRAASAQHCRKVSAFGEGYSEYQSNPDFWANETVRAGVREFWSAFPDAEGMLNYLVARDAEGVVPFEVCATPMYAYATFSDIQFGYVAYWNKDSIQGSFWQVQPIYLEGPLFEFFPNVLNDQYSIAYTVYGDAGRIGWRAFVVDAQAASSTQIEACYGGLDAFDPAAAVETYDFSCTIEYVPLEEASEESMMGESMMQSDT